MWLYVLGDKIKCFLVHTAVSVFILTNLTTPPHINLTWLTLLCSTYIPLRVMCTTPGIPLLASASVFSLTQPSLIGPPVVVLSLLLAHYHSHTLRGMLTPMSILLNLLPNSGGFTSFWTVAFAILMSSPQPATLTFGNHHSKKLLFLLVFVTLPRGVWATPSVQDTEVLSKAAALISMFWMRARARTETEPGEAPLPPLDNPNILGSTSLPSHGLHVMHMNIRGGISTYAKWRTVVEITALKNPDVLVITETGHDNHPSTLRWATRNMIPNELDDPDARGRLGDHFNNSLPYNIYSTEGQSTQGERGGVVVLVHESLSHRVLGKPHVPPHKRWLTITLATPDEHVKIIATYMRPSPQSNPTARAEWSQLTDYAVRLGIKKHTVLIMGDLNASLNTKHTRRFTARSKRVQEHLLTSLQTAGRLVDIFPRLHPGTHCCTWWNTRTWSSPDHALISEYQAHRVLAAQIDLSTPLSYGLDHGLLSVVLNTSESPRAPATKRALRLRFTKDKIPLFQNTIRKSLESPTIGLSPMERGEHLLASLSSVSSDMFMQKGHHSHRNHKVLSMWNDIKVLNRILAYHQSGDTPPPSLLRRKVYKEAKDHTPAGITALLQELKASINSKARKRATATKFMFRSSRSTYFSENRMGKFLDLALNRSSAFKGAVGFVNDVFSETISTDPKQTIDLVHSRVSSTFYTCNRVNQPPAFPPEGQPHDYSHLPPCIRTVWRTRKRRTRIYDGVMDPITGADLRKLLNSMGKNKTPGPSGVTVEMLRHLPDDIMDEWLLPLVNHCLTNQTLPASQKTFLVWCIEKEAGTGSIVHPTDKLQLRPISLFEVYTKLIEATINKRLMRICHQHDVLHPSQHGFRSDSDTTEAMLTYALLMEDAKSTKREIHLSNNDCSKAYDSVPHWATSFIYDIHGFPPALQRMLKSLEGDLHGRILTAHGPGPSFPMERGLGQGSVLAPLKWNLFLNPLLRLMDATDDPYTIGYGSDEQQLRAVAFADDMTVIASTHRGYRARMNLTSEYLNFFGVELNPKKTTYTYYNTRRHFDPVSIKTTSPTGTVSFSPTAVASPYTPLRYLGGHMCPATSWHHAKTLLQAEVRTLLGILKHKNLSIKEYKYVTQSVLMAKMRYYLTVVPMTNRELDTIDAQITSILKHNLGTATSTSSPLFHMDSTTTHGLSFPSIRDIRATSILEKAHYLLNTDNPLGRIARSRVVDLRDKLGWTASPLATPAKASPHLWREHWMGRVMHLLWESNSTIADPSARFSRPTNRARDIPLSQALPPDIFLHLRPQLRTHNIYWIGDMANQAGTRPINPLTKGFRHSPWWDTLLRHTTSAATGELFDKVSQAPAPLNPMSIMHRPGTIVTFPWMNADGTMEPPHKNLFYKVKDTFRDDRGRERCHLTQLVPAPFRAHQIQNPASRRWNQATFKDDHPLVLDTQDTQDFANSLTPVPHRWLRHKDHKDRVTNIVIITHRHKASFGSTHLIGPLDLQGLLDINNRFAARFETRDGQVFSDSENDDIGECSVCQETGLLFECSMATACKRWYHLACTSLPRIPAGNWVCPACVATRPRHTLPEVVLENLYELAGDDEPIFTSSDGSYKERNNSSTYGVNIHASNTNLNYSVGGHVDVQKCEASSLRMEIEGLIAAYELIPADIHPIHYMDNTEAIAIHKNLCRYGLPTSRKLMRMHYRRSITLLWHRMSQRGRHLTVEHVHSHLEKETPEDHPLYIPRWQLAAADTACEEAHSYCEFEPIPVLGTEAFPIYHNQRYIEKRPGQTLTRFILERHTVNLCKLTQEGALQRAFPMATDNIKKARLLPEFLLKFRHKLWLQRLPTAVLRHHRDDHEDGVPIQPECALCLSRGIRTPETLIHIFMQCTGADRLTHLRLKINNVFRQYLRLSVHSDYDSREQLLYLTADDPDIQSHPGWTRVHTDKLDRKQIRDTGPLSFSVPGAEKPRRPDWLLEALRRSLNPLHAFPRTSILDEPNAHGFDMGELFATPPVDTVDHHLINKLTSFLGIEIIIDPNPINPLLETCYLTPEQFLEDKPTTLRPILLVLPFLHNTSVFRKVLRLTAESPRVILYTATQRRIHRLADSSFNLLLSAPPNSITMIPKWYWYGERRYIPSKNTITSHLYLGLDNHSLPEQDYDYVDAILSVRRIDPESPTTITLPEVDTTTPYFPETPNSLRDTLFSQNTAATLALLAGAIPLAVRDGLSSLLPPCDIPSLLRLLRYTILEHQYQSWMLRNEAQPRPNHTPCYARPKQPKAIPASPVPPRTKKRKRRSREETWSRNRAAWKRMRTYWEDLPVAQPPEDRSVPSAPLVSLNKSPPGRRTTAIEKGHLAPIQPPRPAPRTRSIHRRNEAAAAINPPTPARRKAPRRRQEDFPPPSSRPKRRRITYGGDGEG